MNPVPKVNCVFQIRNTKKALYCQQCPTKTTWRVVYAYAHHDTVSIPRCPRHMGSWARLHGLTVPLGATA